MELEKTISQGIMDAMKAHDDVRRDTLRNIKKQIIEAKTAGPVIDALPDEAVLKIIAKMAKQGTDTAEVFQQQGRDDLYEYEMAQVAVLKEFLPEQLEGEELVEKIKEIIAETGAEGMKDMGKVMGVATKRLAGKADGRAVSDMVRKLLS